MSSVDYWENRYASGGNSGAGSQGEAAERKAGYVNALVARHEVSSVVDWGCGEGQQLELLDLPGYLGVDVSPTAIRACLARFNGSFLCLDPLATVTIDISADLALSMDVAFHLVDDSEFEAYMRRLFGSARRLVCIHSTDHESTPIGHMRHRAISPYIETTFPEWERIDWRPTTEAAFFLYSRRPV